MIPPATTPLDFQPSDEIRSFLQRLVGQSVELQLRSGEKLGGQIEVVGGHAVHVTRLRGHEFYDAVIVLSEIAAVIVRTR